MYVTLPHEPFSQPPQTPPSPPHTSWAQLRLTQLPNPIQLPEYSNLPQVSTTHTTSLYATTPNLLRPPTHLSTPSTHRLFKITGGVVVKCRSMTALEPNKIKEKTGQGWYEFTAARINTFHSSMDGGILRRINKIPVVFLYLGSVS